MIILNFFLLSLVLWVFFIAVANLSNNHKASPYTGIKLALATGAVYVFVAFDILFNVVYGTLVFWQWPTRSRLTLTHRLKHILFEQEVTWRWHVAHFVCRRMIEPWDWNHCGLSNA